MMSAFEGDKAETKTMLPVIEVFMAAHDLPDVTVRPQPGVGATGATALVRVHPQCPRLRIETVSDLMGHSGTTVTESVYRHEIRPALTTGATAMNKIPSRELARSA
jgi:hypothetical protein